MKSIRRLKLSEDQAVIAGTQLLDLLRIPYTKTDASMSFGRDGQPRLGKVAKSWPDYTAILPGGRACLIEFKSTDGKFQPGQLEMIERLEAAGALVCVARCVEDLADALYDAGMRHHVLDQLRRLNK